MFCTQCATNLNKHTKESGTKLPILFFTLKFNFLQLRLLKMTYKQPEKTPILTNSAITVKKRLQSSCGPGANPSKLLFPVFLIKLVHLLEYTIVTNTQA